MRKYVSLLSVISISVGLALVTPAWADMLLVDKDPTDSYTNPQSLTTSNPSTEEAWLEKLLGVVNVSYLGKDEDGTWNDGIWNEGNPSYDWTYAVLKYGVGRPSNSNPNHWAIVDSSNNNVLDFGSIAGLPARGLSHITYFGTTSVPVPEPATGLLLGAGLIGVAGIRGKKFKKS